ncbi:hypothetical protein BH23BAC2_BH23BAC2_25700 [soil metagenome]
MRIKIFTPAFLTFLISFSVFGQDTIYYDAERKKTNFSFNAETYIVTTTAGLPKGIEGVKRNYNINGQIITETFYSNLKKDEVTGQRTSWTKDGNKKSEAVYEKGRLHGNFFTYWHNGQIKRKDFYQKGKFKNGAVWDIDGNEIEYFPLEVKAKFPGGQAVLQNYLKENIKTPANITGRVVVHFKIDQTGKVSIEKITGDRVELKMEAYRVVSIMPDWEPALQDGDPVVCNITLPLVFAHQ